MSLSLLTLLLLAGGIGLSDMFDMATAACMPGVKCGAGTAAAPAPCGVPARISGEMGEDLAFGIGESWACSRSAGGGEQRRIRSL